MWTKLDPKKLFGSLIYSGKDNYYRIDLKQDESLNPKHKHILKYGTGCFFIIKTASKYLNIKYKVHYRRTAQEYYPLKWGAEVVVFAKINGTWELLNHWQDTMKDAGGELKNSYDTMEANETYTIHFDLSRTNGAELFQICLPSQGRIDSIETETDSQVEQLFEKPKIALAGSSIAACTASSPAHSFSAMAYRKYGINILNCGISGDHTFNCKELMSELKKLKLKTVVVDCLHLAEKTLLKYKNNTNFIYYLVSPVAVQYERFDIKKYFNKDCISKITGEGHLDITHLNSAGISYYLKQLKQKGII